MCHRSQLPNLDDFVSFLFISNSFLFIAATAMVFVHCVLLDISAFFVNKRSLQYRECCTPGWGGCCDVSVFQIICWK